MTEASKRCCKCKEDLPATPEFFWRDRSQKDGFYPYCKACYYELPCAKRREAIRAEKRNGRPVREYARRA